LFPWPRKVPRIRCESFGKLQLMITNVRPTIINFNQAVETSAYSSRDKKQWVKI